MKVSLMVKTAGKTAGQAIPVTLSQFIIGRDPQCNLRPASPVISKRHCAVLIKAGKVSVRDFDSTNGTFVNDKQIKGEVPLNNEDTLKVGPLEFRVVIEKTTPVNKPTPPPTKAIAGNEEDVAAMLLSLQEDEETDASNPASDDSDVPGGSTVMDMVPLPSEDAAEPGKAPAKPQAAKAPAAKAPTSKTPPPPAKAPAKPATPADTASDAPAPAATSAEIPAAKSGEKPGSKPGEKPGEKPGDKAQPQHASARDAARAILEKHFKRPRG